MNILVTGGCGVIGTALINELRNRNHSVISCDLFHQHDETGFSPNMNGGSYARCDVGEWRQVNRLFDHFGPFDLVYHTAAEFGRWNGEDFYENLWRTNVVGTKNIIRQQELSQFKLVHFSSSEVYGDWPKCMVETTMDEQPIKQLNDYAMTKWVNEMQVRNSMKQRDTRSVIVRLFNTYGPGEFYSPYRSVNCRFVYCAIHGLPWIVHTRHRRTSICIPDAIRTLANIADNFCSGEVYNIGGTVFHSIKELSDLVLKVTGANPNLATESPPEIMTTLSKKVDCSRAIKDLNHQCTVALEAGLMETANWMRSVYGK